MTTAGGHEHTWNDDGACRVFLDVARRLTRCHARRCAAPDCESKRNPPTDYCRDHVVFARRLVLPAR